MARSFLVGALAVTSLFTAQTYAQTDPIWTNATCTKQLWSANSAGWSPCLVSAYLSAQCTPDNSWGVPAIEIGYAPPNGTHANSCLCNSVQWNLLSACSMCQGGSTDTWKQWVVNCSSTVTTTASQGGYPLPIPSSVLVPHWAYYDFSLSGFFNAVIASQQTGPESSAVAAATPTGSSASATGASGTTNTGTAQVTGTNVPSVDDSKSSGSNTGAIVGGIVGGIVGIALIAVIAFIVIRKNKQNEHRAAENQYNQSHHNPSIAPQPGMGTQAMGQYQPVVRHSRMPPLSGSEYNPYDPSDPSAFPSPSYTTTSHYVGSIPHSHQTQARPHSGVPEF